MVALDGGRCGRGRFVLYCAAGRAMAGAGPRCSAFEGRSALVDLILEQTHTVHSKAVMRMPKKMLNAIRMRTGVRQKIGSALNGSSVSSSSSILGNQLSKQAISQSVSHMSTC